MIYRFKILVNSLINNIKISFNQYKQILSIFTSLEKPTWNHADMPCFTAQHKLGSDRWKLLCVHSCEPGSREPQKEDFGGKSPPNPEISYYKASRSKMTERSIMGIHANEYIRPCIYVYHCNRTYMSLHLHIRFYL